MSGLLALLRPGGRRSCSGTDGADGLCGGGGGSSTSPVRAPSAADRREHDDQALVANCRPWALGGMRAATSAATGDRWDTADATDELARACGAPHRTKANLRTAAAAAASAAAAGNDCHLAAAIAVGAPSEAEVEMIARLREAYGGEGSNAKFALVGTRRVERALAPPPPSASAAARPAARARRSRSPAGSPRDGGPPSGARAARRARSALGCSWAPRRAA